MSISFRKSIHFRKGVFLLRKEYFFQKRSFLLGKQYFLKKISNSFWKRIFQLAKECFFQKRSRKGCFLGRIILLRKGYFFLEKSISFRKAVFFLEKEHLFQEKKIFEKKKNKVEIYVLARLDKRILTYFSLSKDFKNKPLKPTNILIISYKTLRGRYIK